MHDEKFCGLESRYDAHIRKANATRLNAVPSAQSIKHGVKSRAVASRTCVRRERSQEFNEQICNSIAVLSSRSLHHGRAFAILRTNCVDHRSVS